MSFPHLMLPMGSSMAQSPRCCRGCAGTRTDPGQRHTERVPPEPVLDLGAVSTLLKLCLCLSQQERDNTDLTSLPLSRECK